MPNHKRPSELIQFRLNENDANFPDDPAAMAVLRKWREEDKPDRETLTKALLALGGYDIAPPSLDQVTRRLLSLANRLEKVAEELKKIDRSNAVYVEGERAGQPVDFDFISNILGGLTNRVVDNDDDE